MGFSRQFSEISTGCNRPIAVFPGAQSGVWLAAKPVIGFLALNDSDGLLSVFMRGTNLHAFWDHEMMALVSEDPIAWVSRLKQNAQSPQFKKMQGLNPIDIAQKSCRIVARPDFYPPHKVNEEYVKTFTPVMERQMVSAVSRLARTLNEVWR